LATTLESYPVKGLHFFYIIGALAWHCFSTHSRTELVHMIQWSQTGRICQKTSLI